SSSLLLAATAFGSWPFWLSALLWPAPLIIAARCLPLPLGLPVVFVMSALGRAIAFHAGMLHDDPVPAICAGAALCGVAVVDGLVAALLPRASWFPFPCALAVLARALDGTQVGQVLAPLPSLHLAAFMANAAGSSAATFFLALLATSFASVG